MTVLVLLLALLFPVCAVVFTLSSTITSNRRVTRQMRRALQQTRLSRVMAKVRW